MQKITINRFDGGMTNDPRDPATNRARLIQHFDALTNAHKLTPYRSQQSGDSAANAHQFLNFAYDGATVYALGAKSANPTFINAFKITDLTTTSWTENAFSPNNGYSSALGQFFTFYKLTSRLYGIGVAAGTYYVYSIKADFTGATQQEVSLGSSVSTVSNGVVHSKDDVLYVGYDNKIATNNNGTWNATALTLPSDKIVSSICEYGNYLAIGCRSTSTLRSTVYLWDRNSSLTTVSENIDWLEGDLVVLEQLEGYLVGVSLKNGFNSRAVFRYYSPGLGAVKFAEFVSSNSTSLAHTNGYRIKSNGRILFTGSFFIGSTLYSGVWGIGRSSTASPLCVTLEHLTNTAPTSAGSMYGLAAVNDYLLTAYSDGTTYYTDTTVGTASYTYTSAYESTISPGMNGSLAEDRILQKQLGVAALEMAPLTSGQQAVLKYRVDGGAWTTILTASAVGTVVAEKATDATGNAFAAGREYEFRIESTGGAEITGLTYGYNVIKTLL